MNIINLLVVLATYFCNSAYCHDCLRQPLFSTKTPYNLVFNNNTYVATIPGCQVVQINMVHRHGHRYPSKEDINSMEDLFKLLQFADKVLVQSNISIPKNIPFIVKHEKLLNDVGEKDLYNIGKRIRKRFPNLFNKGYSPDLFKFVSSCKTRCLQSSSALASGLFEGMGSLGACRFQPVSIESQSCRQDQLLRFFDLCQKYIVDVKNSSLSLEEMKLFGKSSEIALIIQKIKMKLGIIQVLTEKHLQALYMYCAYEIGMFNGSFVTGLCSLLDEEDLHVLEYYLDLKHYYRRSKGFSVTYESSCPLLVDIISSLKMASLNQRKYFKGIFRSSHAETVIPLYTLLGLNLDDQKLTSSNFNDMKNRKFRPSCISPFSGNVYFVLYDCGNGKHKIQLYVNEWLVKIPCCESKYECDFETFLKCYESIVAECNFNEICSLKKIEL